jgi:uncharacterized paraquat-inducible protein A
VKSPIKVESEMISISYEEFMQLVALRRRNKEAQEEKKHDVVREKVLRSDQQIHFNKSRQKELATCPICDALVDADILHPHSGLCPICHEEAHLRNR